MELSFEEYDALARLNNRMVAQAMHEAMASAALSSGEETRALEADKQRLITQCADAYSSAWLQAEKVVATWMLKCETLERENKRIAALDAMVTTLRATVQQQGQEIAHLRGVPHRKPEMYPAPPPPRYGDALVNLAILPLFSTLPPTGDIPASPTEFIGTGPVRS